MQILWSVNILICPIGSGMVITIPALHIQVGTLRRFSSEWKFN